MLASFFLAAAVTSLMRADAYITSMHCNMCGCSVPAAAVAYSKAHTGAGGISAALSRCKVVLAAFLSHV